MSLKIVGPIAIPGAAGSDFDHAAFDAKSRRVFIAHTARDCVEVIDHDAGRHVARLPGFPGVAGAAADDGPILITPPVAPASRGSTPGTGLTIRDGGYRAVTSTKPSSD